MTQFSIEKREMQSRKTTFRRNWLHIIQNESLVLPHNDPKQRTRPSLQSQM
jgi:hypothetical protein